MPASPTQTVVVHCSQSDGIGTGQTLGQDIMKAFGGLSPDAVILFVSPRYDTKAVVNALTEACRPKTLVGCSSAGEFTHEIQDQGYACAIAIRSSEIRFSAGMGHHLSQNRENAADEVLRGLTGSNEVFHGYSSALILTDALAGHADELIEALTVRTGGNYQFFGGGAGDDASFRSTQVICGTEVSSDAVVALEILSLKPVGIGVRHGWKPASELMRVTEASGPVLVSLNGIEAVEVFKEHATATSQVLDLSDPLPFFLHNILGIQTAEGFKLRVPLAIGSNGAVNCAAEIPVGATVCIMGTDVESAKNAAADASKDALAQLQGHKPKVALFFDCVATRLRMGKDFGIELAALRRTLGDTQFAGCNTYGQVARVDGQFSGFHNCTAVVCVLPE